MIKQIEYFSQDLNRLLEKPNINVKSNRTFLEEEHSNQKAFEIYNSIIKKYLKKINK